MAVTSVKEFVCKMENQIDKILNVINDPTSSEHSKRIFIIDNKGAMIKIEETINKILKDVESSESNAQDLKMLRDLKENFDKTKEEIYSSLLSIECNGSIEDNKENFKSDFIEENKIKEINVFTWHVITDGKVNTYEKISREDINEVINNEIINGNFNMNDIVVIKGGELMPLKTKIVVI